MAQGVSLNPPALNDPESRRLRAEIYALLAAVLSAPPGRELLGFLANIEPSPAAKNAGDGALPQAGENDLGQAWQQLRQAAANALDAAETGADAAPESLDDEYHALFIGLGRGEVVPFGSWHLTGFLMEQPLSDLRDDLQSLGLEAGAAHRDPEDHIAALCESMALIIRADDIDEAREQRFFARHLQPWAGRFFADLQSAKSARFYRPVGLLGQRFVALEAQFLDLQAD